MGALSVRRYVAPADDAGTAQLARARPTEVTLVPRHPSESPAKNQSESPATGARDDPPTGVPVMRSGMSVAMVDALSQVRELATTARISIVLSLASPGAMSPAAASNSASSAGISSARGRIC